MARVNVGEETRSVICVLGMHRSGSSLVAQVLRRGGAETGPALIGPSESNPDGHFEDRFVLGVNKKLLIRYGGTWDRPPSLPEGWLDDPFVRRLLDAASGYRRDVVARAKRFLFKEPRTCLLLPFWCRAFGEMTYVVVLRSPESVARSVVARNREWRRLARLPWRIRRTIGNRWIGEHEKLRRIDSGQASDLWRRYYGDVVREVSGREVVTVVYERILADPTAEVARLVRRVIPEGSVAAAVEAVNPALDHAPDRGESPEVRVWLERLEACGGEGA
jgi:hypothetical protein